LGVYITKADGSRQLFDREKVVRTCLRMGVNRSIAYKIVGEVEQQLYDGITTNKIFNLTFRLLRNYKPTIKHFLDLRKSLSLMVSKPEFEKFIQVLLSYNGYSVSGNRLLMGKCVKHEVDGIAQKNGITYFVEAKHHQNYHTPTGLDESRIARAVLEDITEGYELGKNKLRIDRAMIVTNTRFSEHAKIYGKCRDILQIGWSSPATTSLQSIIEEKKAHPLSCIKGLNNSTRIRLVNSGVVLIKELMDFDTSKLSKISGVSKSTLRKVIEKAKNYPF
jgi:hypothetical protein